MEQNENTASQESITDVVYGSISGIAGKLIEYPFDTVKVRLQSQPDNRPLQFTGPLDCFKQSIKHEGIRGLYRGISSPIVGAAAENASLFWGYNLAQRLVSPIGLSPMAASLVCGSISGVVTSFILTPIELIKCKMQVQTLPQFSSSKARHHGVLRLILDVYKHYGIRGYWHGQTGTLLRECGGSAAWFGANEYVKLFFQKLNNRKDNTIGELLLGGAAAGISYNVSLFPADTIKSRIQTETMLHPTQQMSFWQCGKLIVRNGGIRALYRGCGITVCRAAPSSAVIFVTYEKLKELDKYIYK
ncbi:hypothetical protein TRICI_005829 [Trichomonascus ciferrii]|uniref:Uncharacterized protein n=1 Tax=Trichomonascus ciferrii TaxID=44093 RepID=A0A642UNU6_9ASCO|nr:hypothetical protein TRICI_005829 [Trichomonascus ciferrii]